MFQRIVQKKFLIVFISAFLCLNLSGSFCLAYCQIKDLNTKTEHCPLAKLDAENCPMSKTAGLPDAGFKVAKGISPDCCNLAINVFAATLEKHHISFQKAETARKEISFFQPIYFERAEYSSDFSYKKPLYDRRAERLKNRVFRI